MWPSCTTRTWNFHFWKFYVGSTDSWQCDKPDKKLWLHQHSNPGVFLILDRTTWKFDTRSMQSWHCFGPSVHFGSIMTGRFTFKTLSERYGNNFDNKWKNIFAFQGPHQIYFIRDMVYIHNDLSADLFAKTKKDLSKRTIRECSATCAEAKSTLRRKSQIGRRILLCGNCRLGLLQCIFCMILQQDLINRMPQSLPVIWYTRPFTCPRRKLQANFHQWERSVKTGQFSKWQQFSWQDRRNISSLSHFLINEPAFLTAF